MVLEAAYPYQRIAGRNNGTDRLPDYWQIFPAYPIGQRILDLGCYIGFYCIQAAQDGAEYCLGVEKVGAFAQKARELATAERLPSVEILTASVLDIVISERYNTVLCLNLLHHFTIKEVRLLLDSIDTWSLERMVFTIIPPKDTSRYKKRRKLHISPAFFESMWPTYEIKVSPVPTMPDRLLLDITK